MNPQNIEDDLAACEFFKGFDKADIEKVAAICEVRSCKAGSILFQQGDFGGIACGQRVMGRLPCLGGAVRTIGACGAVQRWQDIGQITFILNKTLTFP